MGHHMLKDELKKAINPRPSGTGTFTPPPLDLAAIKARASAITDPQIKTDLFRLILEVELKSR